MTHTREPRLGQGGEYQLLTNMFPLFPSHMLLVACEEVRYLVITP